jgi:beta-barrel assembly-enhancing protease
MKRSLSMLASVTSTVLIAFAAMMINGCETMQPVLDAGTALGVASGTITQDQADSIKRGGKAVSKSFEDITPEQEYYIGRAVAATILEKYLPYNNEEANRYVNLVGQTLAQASDRPETFGGYHFLILDSTEINAFAAPGGLILVTRGMLQCCGSEDALAAVLAHEIGHIQGQDGLRAIKTGRLTAAFNVLAMEGAKHFAGPELAKLTEAFEGSVGDIVSTLVNNGYSRELERQADDTAVRILTRVGYNPSALVDMLKEMDKRLKPGGQDFAKTHPGPKDRIGEIQVQVTRFPPRPTPLARQKRFDRAIGAV